MCGLGPERIRKLDIFRGCKKSGGIIKWIKFFFALCMVLLLEKVVADFSKKFFDKYLACEVNVI